MITITNARVPGSGRPIDIEVQGGVVTRVSMPVTSEAAVSADVADATARIWPADLAPTTDFNHMLAGVGGGTPAITGASRSSAGANRDDEANTVIDAAGRWIIPGLWDHHTHFTQWASTFGRLDLIDARSAGEAMDMLRRYIDERRAAPGGLDPDTFVVGMRFRHSLWSRYEQPTLAAIDEATGDQPVALSSMDMHCGWVNSAAARRLGVSVEKSGLVGELDWFDAYCKLDNAPGAADETLRMIRLAEADAARKGVVGIRDYEMTDDNLGIWMKRFVTCAPQPDDFETNPAWHGIDWEESFAHGIRGLRVDAGVYPEQLQTMINSHWHTGMKLPGSDGLGRVGAMKMIADGSLNTRSAYCSAPYTDIFPDSYGTLSYTPDQIEAYFHLATRHGFDIACHAIGDEANTIVLNAAEATRAHGSIEHAQLLKPKDIARFAKLGIAASIQPQHAMDDRDVIARFWAEPAGIPYAFRSLKESGATLLMGSDAPVAPLDPWMAISAAVFGSFTSDRSPFQPEQRLDVRTALAASTAVGRDTLQAGDQADLVLLDRDPYAADSPEEMRAMGDHVAATMMNGRWTYNVL
ncbi:amidohydrolase [Bifidobacterium leontopitheci]|uniref:Amidohydrolase n=1 Tax=Bifidobacterium leontopitheci TaxID=2650774 RepID=A0A6I1GJ33_9BIFI|nr:amidohydrolase [Bifidobacterium leontopitheci]KAB7789636.1 amidohydrolase [Bifidobacterium leontopitheci]